MPAHQEQYVSEKVQQAEYAVRGAVSQRADAISKALKSGSAHGYPFSSLLRCNIGNPQAVGQKPLTFVRQATALFTAPMLLEHPLVGEMFPSDVITRVKGVLKEVGGVTGAYTASNGHAYARNDAAFYITERDRRNSKNPNLPAADPEQICITDGSSAGVRMLMQLVLDGPGDAAMIPIPQYPLYSALLALLGSKAAPYYLHETKGWSLAIDELEQSFQASVAAGSTPRLFVVINPGNPTGQVLSRDTIEAILRFAHAKSLLVMADEVYQENIYCAGDKNFHSFREVLLSLPADDPVRTETQLVSMQTVSKGIIGECGFRGGYFEYLNFSQPSKEQLVKLTGINLCANVCGQLMVSLMCRPPQAGDASYALYRAEYDGIFTSLQKKALLVTAALNEIPGITCNPTDGAMYAFPRIELPAKYLARNDALNKEVASAAKPMSVDTRYCLELMEATGIVLVPGSGFGQEPGTLHLRATILPPEEQIERLVSGLRQFHATIIEQYGPL